MKRLFIILILATLSVASIAAYQTKRGAITTGYTMLSRKVVLTAVDSLAGNGGFHIVTNDSLVILISNPQVYLQYQTFTSTLGINSGSGTVTIKAYGKVTSADNWHPIGSAVTWTTTGNNPGTITATLAKNYNFFRVSYVQSGGAECARLVTFDVKTANAFPYGAIIITGTAGETVTGGVVSLNASSNYAVNIGTGTTTSTITFGGAGAQTIAIGNGAAAKTVALGSSNTTSTTTILSGSNAVNVNASNNQPTNINTGTSTGLVTIGGGSGTAAINTTAWGITTAGIASVGSIIVAQDTCKGVRATGKAVGGLGVLRVTAACTLQGLTGGVTGQLLRILNTSATTLVLKHNGTGTQKFMISGAGDLTLTGQYNSVTLSFDGTYWFITGKGQ